MAKVGTPQNDVALSITLTRDELGLEPLEIATSPNFYIAADSFMGASVTWDRQQLESPFLDGALTTSRRRAQVTEQIGVEVRGPDLVWVHSRMAALIAAFTQSQFFLTIRAGNSTRQYRCEAADYQDMTWNTPRLASAAGQMVFSVPRQPAARIGGY